MYQAIITAVTQVRPHGNADKLNLATVGGHQVVIGKNVTEGTLGIFFPTDGQLSDEYANANDLVARYDVVDGKKVKVGGGFFDEKKRVRAQKFRGEKSEGIWMELDSLAFTGYDLSLLRAGDTITELNGVQLCQRYETPATRRARQTQGKPKPKKKTFLPEHVDTKQYRFFADTLPVGSTVYLTEKLHGTSHRIGHVPSMNPIAGWKTRVLNVVDKLFGIKRANENFETWAVEHGSRRVVLGKPEDQKGGFYGTHDFRFRATGNVAPLPGEVIYGEIVGYTGENAPIMGVQEVTGKELEEVKSRYGDKMEYSYGCVNGEAKFYVYRITRMLDGDGGQMDLTWPQVKKRCGELGLTPAPDLLWHPLTVDDVHDRGLIKNIVESMMDGPSNLDLKHIREGVAIRVEGPNGTEFFKAKSFAFGVLEGYIKSNDDYVDTEEVESA